MLTRKVGVLIQQFCDGMHWHNLALIGPEARAYYWDPFGGDIDSIRSLAVKHPPWRV